MLLDINDSSPETESGLVPVIVDRTIERLEIARRDHGLREVIPAADVDNGQRYEGLQD